MTEDERDRVVAQLIKSGTCPFGMLQPGQTIGYCPSGFPGCGCGDEIMNNPHLKEALDSACDALFSAAIESRPKSEE
jgi:hypothetical protein